MAQILPIGSHIFLGAFASDADALTYIRAMKWDTTHDGTGNPQYGMAYFNTAEGVLRTRRDVGPGVLDAWVEAISVFGASPPLTGCIPFFSSDPGNTVNADPYFTIDAGRMRVGGLRTYAATPAQIVADQNDYALPAGSPLGMMIRLSTDALRNITGIVAVADCLVCVINVGAFNLVLQHENIGSVAANRILSPTGADYTLQPNESAWLWYDQVTARWRVLYP